MSQNSRHSIKALYTLPALEPIVGVVRGPGRFDDAVEAADGDAVAQFIAFPGRTAASA